MPAVDQRLLRASPAGRKFAFACVPLGVATALTIVVQATLIGNIVADVFLGHRGLAAVAPLLALLAAPPSRAACSRGRSRRAATSRRARPRASCAGGSCRHALGDRPGDPRPRAATSTTAAVAGVDALDPYFARYLPQLVLGVVVPLVILLRVVTLDVVSAVVMAVTLPLIPIFGILVGRGRPSGRARARYAALGRLSSHFLDVVRGLTTLRAFNRGAIQADRLAETGEALPSRDDGHAAGRVPLGPGARARRDARHRRRRGRDRRPSRSTAAWRSLRR